MVTRLLYARSPATAAAEKRLHTSILQTTIEFSLANFLPSSLARCSSQTGEGKGDLVPIIGIQLPGLAFDVGRTFGPNSLLEILYSLLLSSILGNMKLLSLALLFTALVGAVPGNGGGKHCPTKTVYKTKYETVYKTTTKYQTIYKTKTVTE
jgi:hypothetical protein